MGAGGRANWGPALHFGAVTSGMLLPLALALPVLKAVALVVAVRQVASAEPFVHRHWPAPGR